MIRRQASSESQSVRVTARHWVRAVTVALMVSAVATLLLIVLPHLLLTQLLSLSRAIRVALATAWVGIVTIALLWIMWRVSLVRPAAPRS